MTDVNNNNKEEPEKEAPEQEDFAQLFEESLKQPKVGQFIKGKVVNVTGDSVMVDIGYKAEGVVPIREFLDKDGNPVVEVGQEISVMVVRWEDEKGYVALSKSRADELKTFDELEEAGRRNAKVKGRITRAVNGGFYVDIKGVTAFLPNSQVDLKPVKDPASVEGKEFEFRVIKFSRPKQNVIVSRRVILEEERDTKRKATLERIKEGDEVEGVVKNVTDYGAFMDLGGVDGLVHLSDMSWGKVTNPSQIVKIGDRVKVKVLKYDQAANKISLGMKQVMPDPWASVKDKYPAGSKVEGRVTSVAEYGAFVEMEPGLEGLVHISEMSWTKVKHPSQKLKSGDRVTVMVLDADPQTRRISLGLKQIEANPWDELAEKYPKGSVVKGVVKNITDFGVFIGITEGVDGLIHISDISWKKVKHPSEVFTKGQEVSATVLNVDRNSQRFSLSTKVLEKNPWAGAAERYKPGMTVKGRVTGLADFGAFVAIEEGLEGLVHVSELQRAKKKGVDIKVGALVEVEVLNVNTDDKKIGLSIRSSSAPSASGGRTDDGEGETKE